MGFGISSKRLARMAAMRNDIHKLTHEQLMEKYNLKKSQVYNDIDYIVSEDLKTVNSKNIAHEIIQNAKLRQNVALGMLADLQKRDKINKQQHIVLGILKKLEESDKMRIDILSKLKIIDSQPDTEIKVNLWSELKKEIEIVNNDTKN